MGIEFVISLNRQGKIRLGKWYNGSNIKEQRAMIKKVYLAIHGMSQPNSYNLVRFDHQYKLVFRKYNGLYFIICVREEDGKNNKELMYLQFIPLFVETLDSYFENVSELDLIFNFYKTYRILDEFIINGELVTIDKEAILSNLKALD